MLYRSGYCYYRKFRWVIWIRWIVRYFIWFKQWDWRVPAFWVFKQCNHMEWKCNETSIRWNQGRFLIDWETVDKAWLLVGSVSKEWRRFTKNMSIKDLEFWTWDSQGFTWNMLNHAFPKKTKTLKLPSIMGKTTLVINMISKTQ